MESNERYRRSPKGALLCKRKVGAIKGIERVPRGHHFCQKRKAGKMKDTERVPKKHYCTVKKK
jgi:hypothetical protein